MNAFSSLHPKIRKEAASAFLIWRAGRSVKWDCTTKELAAETGLTKTTVRNICKRHGWELQPDIGATLAHRPAVDHTMGANCPQYRGHA